MRKAAIVLAFAVAGCADFPDLGPDTPEAERAPYPGLLDHAAVTAAVSDEAEPESPLAELNARAAALEARADWLRSQDIDAP